MGLDAFVSCNCYREGKAKPFPLPEFEPYFDAQTLEIDDAAYEAMTDAQREQLYEWRENACEHPEFDYVRQRISNWSGLRAFQEALELMGAVNFQTLLEQIPNGNYGETSPEQAALMLTELDYFRQHANLGQVTWLVDTETGTELYSYIATYSGIFMWSDHYAGVDPRGFFIAQVDSRDRARLGREVFRSMRFEQRILAWKDDGIPAKVEYFDSATERRFTWDRAAVTRHERQEDGRLKPKPIRLAHVITRRITASDFDYILTPLETICRASIEIGNPIVWC
jgi:hypothetical protein